MAKKQYLDLAGLTTYDEEIKAHIDSIASGKANSSHNHAASDITSGTLSSDRLPTVPIAKGGTGATTAAGALTNLGITATAAELNKMDGVTATTTELNYVDGVTSNIQSQLDAKAASSTLSSHTGNKSNPHGVTAAQVGTYTKAEIDSALASKQAAGSYAASSHTHDDRYYTESEINTKLAGKSNTNHTHNYAGSSSAGGAATSANKVNSSLTVKLNGGSTEGTNMFTFNGSAAKSVNITPASIGAQAAGSYAASSHTHDDRYYTESEINTKLAGKSDTNHTHNYAGSSSAGGAANSAKELINSSTGAAMAVGSMSQPVYFDAGVPCLCTSVKATNLNNTSKGSAVQPVYFSSGVPVACSFGKELFSGTWASASITRDGISNYKLFLVEFSGKDTAVLAMIKGTAFRGMGGYSTANSMTTYHISATVSGNTLTWGAANQVTHTFGGNHGAKSDCTVTRIVGLV